MHVFAIMYLDSICKYFKDIYRRFMRELVIL